MRPDLQVVVFVFYVAFCDSAAIQDDVPTGCQDRERREAAGRPESTANYGRGAEVALAVPATSLGIHDLNSAAELLPFPSAKRKRCPSTQSRLSTRAVSDDDQIVGAKSPWGIQRRDLQSEMMKRICKTCQARPQCSVQKKCDQCKRWCIEQEPSTNDITDGTPTNFEEDSNDVPLISNSNVPPEEAQIVSLPNRFSSTSSESKSLEDNIVSLPVPSGDKRVYTIANFSSGPLKELICNLLGISNTTDIEKMVVWVTTFSNQPPKFAVEYKKNVSPLAEKLTDTLNDELKKAMEEKKKQGGNFLTNEEMEEIAQKILAAVNKPKAPEMSDKPSGARSSSSEDQPEFSKDVDFDFSRRVNPDVIEDTIDPKLLQKTAKIDDISSGPRIGSVQEQAKEKNVEVITPDGNTLQQVMNAENEDNKIQSPMVGKEPNTLVTQDLMQQDNLIDQKLKSSPHPHSHLILSAPLDSKFRETEDSHATNQMEPASSKKQPDTPVTKKMVQQMKDSVDKRVKNPKLYLIPPRLGSVKDIQAEDQLTSLQKPEDVNESLSTPQNTEEEPQNNVTGLEQATGPEDSSLDHQKSQIPSDLDTAKTMIGKEPIVAVQDVTEKPEEVQLEEGREGPTNLIAASQVPEEGGLQNEDSKTTPALPITPANQLQDGLSKILQTLRKDSETMPRIIKDFDTAKEVLKDVENIVDEIRKETNIKPDMGQADVSTFGLPKVEEPSSTPLKPLGSEKVYKYLEPQSIRGRLQEKPLSQIDGKLGQPKSEIEDSGDEKLGSQPIEAVPWDKHMTPSMIQRTNQRKNKDNMKLGSPISGELTEVDEPANNIAEDMKTNMEISSHEEEDELGISEPTKIPNQKEPTKDILEEESDLKVIPLDKKVPQISLQNEVLSDKQDLPTRITQSKSQDIDDRENKDTARLGRPGIDDIENIEELSNRQAEEEEIVPQEKLLNKTPSDHLNQLKQLKPNILHQDTMRLGKPNINDTEKMEELSNHLPQKFPDQTMTIHGKEVPLRHKATLESSPQAGDDEMVPHQTLLGKSPSDDLNQLKQLKPSIPQDALILRKPNKDDTEKMDVPTNHVPHAPDQPMTISGKELPLRQKATLESSPQAGDDEMVPHQTLLGKSPSDDLNQLKQLKPSIPQDAMILRKPNKDDTEKMDVPTNHVPHAPDQPMTISGKELPLRQKATLESSPQTGGDEMVPHQTLLGKSPSDNLNQLKQLKPSKFQDAMRLGKPNMDDTEKMDVPTNHVPHAPDQPMTIHDKKVPLNETTTLVQSPQAGEEEMLPQQTLVGKSPSDDLNQLKQLISAPSRLQDTMKLGRPNMDDTENVEGPTIYVPHKFPDQHMTDNGKEIPLKQKTTLETSPHTGEEEMVQPNSLLGRWSPSETQIHPKLTVPSRMQDINERINKDEARLGSPDTDSIPLERKPTFSQSGDKPIPITQFAEDTLDKTPDNLVDSYSTLRSNEALASMRDPALQSRAELSTVGNVLNEPWSNSLGRLIPVKEDQSLPEQAPKGMYFVGNGIKLPLQMVRNNDGDVHLSVDLDKLCTCRNNSLCSNNHTAIGQIVGTPLMGYQNEENDSPNQRLAEKIEGVEGSGKDSGMMTLGTPSSKLEDLEMQHNLVTPRIGRNAANNWLDMKNSIARQVNPDEDFEQTEDNGVFKREASDRGNSPEKLSIPTAIEEGTKDELKENIQFTNTGNSLESLHKFLNEKIMNLKHKVTDAERRDELKSKQLEQSEENLMGALSSFDKDTKPKPLNKMRTIDSIKSLFSPRPLRLKSRFQGSSEEKDITNESHDILTPIKGVGKFKKTEELQDKLEKFNEYVDEYNKENESLLKKEADILVKTQKNSFIKKEVDMMTNILKFLKSVATDNKYN